MTKNIISTKYVEINKKDLKKLSKSGLIKLLLQEKPQTETNEIDQMIKEVKRSRKR